MIATIADAEWLVCSVLCEIDFSHQINVTGFCALFVIGVFHWIINHRQMGDTFVLYHMLIPLFYQQHGVTIGGILIPVAVKII